MWRKNNRNEKRWGIWSGNEVRAFCELCNIRITTYIRTILGKMKQKTDKIQKMVSGEDNNENFSIILDNYGPKYERKNHFEALYPREVII